MATKTDEKLERMLERQAKLNTKIDIEKARVSKIKRAEDTRKKILLGAFMLSDDMDPQLKNMIMMGLDNYLKSDRDRVLLGFVPTPKDDQATNTLDDKSINIDSEKNND